MEALKDKRQNTRGRRRILETWVRGDHSQRERQAAREPTHDARRGTTAILVPIDYSDPSRHAFDLACRLAENGSRSLTLMHVADLPVVSSLGMAEGPPLPAGYRGAWESQLRLLRPRDPAVPVEYRIEEGDPVTAIGKVAGQIRCDRIVLGTRRKMGLGGMLRRSVSREVERDAPCPMLTLTLPPDAQDKTGASTRRVDMLDYRTILHPTDFSESARYAFEVARDLARNTGGQLLLVHVAPDQAYRKRLYRREIEESLRWLAESNPEVWVRKLVLAGDPATQIVSLANQLDCGLIVMGTSGRTGLGRFWYGSVARAVQNRAPCPVLTARLPDNDAGDARAATRRLALKAGAPEAADRISWTRERVV